LKRTLKKLDSAHLDLLNTVAALDDDNFRRRPGDGEWSVAQIAHHLFLVETSVLRALERGERRPPESFSLAQRIKPVSIVGLRLFRVKAPQAAEPGDPPCKVDVLKNLAAVRNTLKAFVEATGEQRLRNITMRHPVFGKIDGVKAIAFVYYHERRHLKQIGAVMKCLNKSAIR
jgi:hypothetical protein